MDTSTQVLYQLYYSSCLIDLVDPHLTNVIIMSKEGSTSDVMWWAQTERWDIYHMSTL